MTATELDERGLDAAIATTPFGNVAREAIGNAIRAYLAALPAPGFDGSAPSGVRVKALEWAQNAQDIEGSLWANVKELDRYYSIDPTSNVFELETHLMMSEYGPDRMGLFPTVEAAKAAAQADYDRRILSALSPAPVAAEAVARTEDVFAALTPFLRPVVDFREVRRVIAVALASPPEAPDGWRPTHRHVKTGGEYQLLGIGKMQATNWAVYTDNHGYDDADMAEVAVYVGKDNHYWVRPRSEFDDGRFDALPAAPTHGQEATP